MNYNQFISPGKSVSSNLKSQFKFIVFRYQNDAIILVIISAFFAIFKIFS